MEPILQLLACGEFVSGERMSEKLGITRAAVWKRIKILQEAGWPIESGGKRGYHLGEHDRLEPETWQHLLSTHTVGRGEIHYEYTLASTNATAKKLYSSGAAPGTVCLCEQQTAGRGRLGRVWESAPGVGLWVSVLMKPSIPPSNAHLMTFCAALAMSDAVHDTCGFQPGIKWPNDLVFKGKKICGILLEVSTDMDRINSVTVGTGLNVWPGAVPEALRAQAGCVADFGTPPNRRTILVRYLEAFEKWTDVLEKDGPPAIISAVSERCVTIGQQVAVSGALSMTGLAVGLDDSGVLLVRDLNGKTRMVLSGDVSVRGIMGYA
ncbi:MAG: biotin--[Clostridia bacterium]|nr:biotin--[acetyl-CoA-carboxylase] ligase [Clostridia bacterium]